ncbi:MAG: hypothetical protein J4473_01600 [Candidatus Aenigmarchaeota archaeon]|nr:hypothetical protein [Candidatus Aenigmarchaeota archaeon]
MDSKKAKEVLGRLNAIKKRFARVEGQLERGKEILKNSSKTMYAEREGKLKRVEETADQFRDIGKERLENYSVKSEAELQHGSTTISGLTKTIEDSITTWNMNVEPRVSEIQKLLKQINKSAHNEAKKDVCKEIRTLVSSLEVFLNDWENTRRTVEEQMKIVMPQIQQMSRKRQRRLGMAALLPLYLSLSSVSLPPRAHLPIESASIERRVDVKLEKPVIPVKGCLTGAFVENDKAVNGSIVNFNERVGHHDVYMSYTGWGRPFPKGLIERAKSVGSIVQIAFEAPKWDMNKIKDDEYLRNFARASKESGCPIFLRFASEMDSNKWGSNPDLYKKKFRLVHDIMEKEAPNVAMVWTISSSKGDFEKYYPGDDCVDWIGINPYWVHHHSDNSLSDESVEELLKPLIDFAKKHNKPVQISEWGVAHKCKVCGKDVPDYAIKKIEEFYKIVREKFPIIKLVTFFDFDAFSEIGRGNDYSVTTNSKVESIYKKVISSSYFANKLRHPA